LWEKCLQPLWSCGHRYGCLFLLILRFVLNMDAFVGWTCFIHSRTSVMVSYIFLKEHECILPMLWLVFTLFTIVVDGLPQIVHSWKFIFLFTWLSQYCRDIFRLCLPTLLIETHFHWFLYQFLSLASPSICILSHVWWMVATSSRLLVPAGIWVGLPGLTVVAIALGEFSYCNQPWWAPCRHLDGLPFYQLHATSLAGSVGWLCGQFLFLTLRSGLVKFLFLTLWSGLIHCSLLRTVSRSYSTVLWGLFIPNHSWELDISFWFGPFASW
jgi:hypothetical protein